MRRERVRAARAAYWLSGKLAWIRTPQRMYRVVWDTPLDDPEPRFHSVPTERRWFRCAWSTRLLERSMEWAPTHWDHFALDHGRCESRHLPCPTRWCGGLLCAGLEEIGAGGDGTG